MNGFIKLLPVAAMLAISIALVYTAWVSLCEGQMGTHAFLSGEFNGVYATCRMYDYSPYFSPEMQPKIKEIQDSYNPLWTRQK